MEGLFLLFVYFFCFGFAIIREFCSFPLFYFVWQILLLVIAPVFLAILILCLPSVTVIVTAFMLFLVMFSENYSFSGSLASWHFVWEYRFRYNYHLWQDDRLFTVFKPQAFQSSQLHLLLPLVDHIPLFIFENINSRLSFTFFWIHVQLNLCSLNSCYSCI